MAVAASYPVSDAPGFANTSRHLVLAGLTAIAAGACGLVMYVGVYVLPPVVSFFGLVILLGIRLLKSELSLDDPVLFGFSIADAITAAIHNYKENWRCFFMLCCLPDLAAEDVVLVCRQRCHGIAGSSRKSTSEAANSSRGAADILPPKAINGTSPCTELVRNSDDPIDEFDAAVGWLRRPCLSLNIREQLHLHSLYLQATIGDAGMDTGSSSPVRCVDRLKFEGWQAVRGMSRAVARSQLPSALAKVDQSFATSHPRLAPRPAAASGVLLQLIERRLPIDLDERVARVQRYAFGSSLVTTVFTLLASLWATLQSRKMRNSRRLGLRSLVPSAISLGMAVSANMYLGALACGLPAWLHALLLRRLKAGGLELASMAVPAGAAGRLRILLLRMVLPRLTRPILAQ